jgi:chitinase
MVSFLRYLAAGLAILSFATAAPIGNSTRSSHSLVKQSDASGHRSVGYFADYKIYDPTKYFPFQLPANNLTHVLFSFAAIQPNGTVYVSIPYRPQDHTRLTFSLRYLQDQWANIDIGRNWTQSGNNAYGNAKELYQLKKTNRNTKVLLSIGGAKASENSDFATIATSESGRKTFAATSVEMVRDLGLDGIDVDWEFPKTDAEAESYVLLLAELRKALDQYSHEHAKDYHFEITIACSAGPSNYNLMHLAEMDMYLDAWHLMFYDYAGAWSKVSGHHSSISNPDSTDYSTDRAVKNHIAAGIPAHKIVLGVGLYGRAFSDTEGLGKPFDNEIEANVATPAYQNLPKAGAKIYHDAAIGAAYSTYTVKSSILFFHANKAP